MEPWLWILLALFGLIGGIGITAVGPGGVLPTIGLFLLSGLSPAGVAGTAIVTHVATGMLGTAAYTRSGQLREPETRRIAIVLAVTALCGTPLGVLANTVVSGPVFGLLLGATVLITGILVWLRERRAKAAGEVAVRLPLVVLIVLGFLVAVAAGLFGIGGPMLSVPLLVICGVPVLPALAAAQFESIVVAAVGSIGYAMQGSINWPLALVVGVPELIGVLIGWKIAHAVPARQLKYTLAALLCGLAPYLAFHG